MPNYCLDRAKILSKNDPYIVDKNGTLRYVHIVQPSVAEFRRQHTQEGVS